MISIALCTYNGAQYLREQLDSILKQTLRPDEIVISDDCSTDSTMSVINEYQAAYPDTAIRVYVNDFNLGYRVNFSKAIEACTGDIIFLSDQDDIWMPDKISTILDWFKKHPKKNVVFTNGRFIDGDSNPIYNNLSLFKCVGMTRMARFWMRCGYCMELFLKNNRATGATMAIRADFKKHFHIENDGPLHDEMICLKAINEECIGFINKKLISYRIHPSQACGLLGSINNPQHTDNIISPLNDHIDNGEYFTDKKLSYRYCLLKDRAVWVKSALGLPCIFRNFDRYIKAYPILSGLCMTYDILLYFRYGRDKNHLE